MDLAFAPGEIHAIVGENGAGKSTLIKLLTGVHPRSAGEIFWQGRPVELATPHAALALGINAVHQEVVLCPHLTVAANMYLGGERTRGGLLQGRRMVREAQAILDDLGFALPAGAVLATLTIGQQQLVATARAAIRGTRFLILDEPTSYLTRAETGQLFALIRRLHAAGVTIVYISHRLEEIFEIAERVSILRDGRLVATRTVAETDQPTLIHDMVNRSLAEIHYKEAVPRGAPLLEVQGYSGPGFADVSLTVHRGEVVGLYGLVGAGRSEFAQCLFGRQPRSAGRLLWEGQPILVRRESEAIARGMALAPESRRDQGLCLGLGVGFNINLPVFHRLSLGPLVDIVAERRHADRQIRELGIRTASRAAPVASLSGGNQQKIVVGKWLNHGADLFIVDEPTVGVDVATKAEIYKVFAALLRAGAGILLISSYLPEVFDIADVLHVFRKGRLIATHARGTGDHQTILRQALGA